MATTNRRHGLTWTPDDDEDAVEQEKLSRREGEAEESGKGSQVEEEDSGTEGTDDEYTEESPDPKESNKAAKWIPVCDRVSAASKKCSPNRLLTIDAPEDS